MLIYIHLQKKGGQVGEGPQPVAPKDTCTCISGKETGIKLHGNLWCGGCQWGFPWALKETLYR